MADIDHHRALEAALEYIPIALANFLRDSDPGMFDAGEVVRACSEFFYQARRGGWTLAAALAAATDATVLQVQAAGLPADDPRRLWLQGQLPHWALGYFA